MYVSSRVRYQRAKNQKRDRCTFLFLFSRISFRRAIWPENVGCANDLDADRPFSCRRSRITHLVLRRDDCHRRRRRSDESENVFDRPAVPISERVVRKILVLSLCPRRRPDESAFLRPFAARCPVTCCSPSLVVVLEYLAVFMPR